MTDDQEQIRLNVADRMNRGLVVFGADGGKIGPVVDYDTALGYMMVRPNPFADSVLYVPFSLITSIDPREVFVSESAATVRRHYADPPPRDVLVDTRVDPETGEDDSRAVVLEPSGYDGTSTVAEVSRIGRIAPYIAQGFHVYTAQMEHIGRVDVYDRESRQMLVRPDIAPWQPLVVPLALVESVDPEEANVYLAVSAADLKRHPHVGSWEAEIDEGEPSGEGGTADSQGPLPPT